MSKCPDPDCNAEGEHVGVMRPWKGGPLQVVHQCLRCDGMVWWEDAKNEAAMLVRFNLEGGRLDLRGIDVNEAKRPEDWR